MEYIQYGGGDSEGTGREKVTVMVYRSDTDGDNTVKKCLFMEEMME